MRRADARAKGSRDDSFQWSECCARRIAGDAEWSVFADERNRVDRRSNTEPLSSKLKSPAELVDRSRSRAIWLMRWRRRWNRSTSRPGVPTVPSEDRVVIPSSRRRRCRRPALNSKA